MGHTVESLAQMFWEKAENCGLNAITLSEKQSKWLIDLLRKELPSYKGESVDIGNLTITDGSFNHGHRLIRLIRN